MRVPKNFTIFTEKHLCWISFWNFRTATFENNFWGLLLKRKQKRRMTHSDYCDFRFSLFPGQLFIKLWNKLFILDYVIHFYIHMKGLSFYFSRFSWQEILAAIRQIIKVLPGNFPLVNECVQWHQSIMWQSRILRRILQTFLSFCVLDYSFLIFFASV